MCRLTKEQILTKAKNKLNQEKDAKKYIKICLKANICPECGEEGLTTETWVEDSEREDLFHDYVKHDCGFKHIIKSRVDDWCDDDEC